VTKSDPLLTMWLFAGDTTREVGYREKGCLFCQKVDRFGKVTKVVEKWSFFSKKSSFLGIYFYFVLSFLEVVFDPVSR